jgi:hypothetical protein
MKNVRKLMTYAASTLLAAACALPAIAQTYAPAIDYTSLLNMKFYDNGMLRFDDANLAFAPADNVDASVEVVSADGKVLGKFDYYPEYAFAAKAFGRIRVKGNAEVQISAPGNYFIRFKISGKPSTRFPFSVKVLGSGDPFDTAKKYQFDGPWRSMAYLWMRPYKTTALPDVVFWTGSADLKAGTTKDQTSAKLFRNGKMIAHSKTAQGHIAAGHYVQSTHAFFAPHEARQAHEAPGLTREQLLVDGNYNIRIERQSDGALLRNFVFTVTGGQIQELPRSVLGYQPHENFIVPRVPVYGSSTYEFRPAIWIQDPTR